MIQQQDILTAYQLIEKYIHRTPVLTSQRLNKIFDAQLFFKCENFQKAGAFKIRGATNAIFTISDDNIKNGVATHSSGNHAAALTLAASMRRIKAEVVMPENSPKIKIAAVREYGANISFCEPTQEAREKTLEQVIHRTGAQFIHPYNNEEVITGQSTAALELLQEHPNLDILIVPVGGGGLLSGSSLTCHYFYPDVKVIGAEPKCADDAYRSLQQGHIIPSITPQTIADGLRTSLGTLTFPIIQKYVHKIILADEKSIILAMKNIWESMKIIVEPSSAVPLAALSENRDYFKGKNVGIILSGGNVDLSSLPF